MSKEHSYAYEAGYRDGAINYELDHCPACKNVADLQEVLDENAELRRELEQWHKLTEGIELPEYPICTFQPKELELENAELRELVRDLLHHIEYPPCEGCLSEMSCAGDLSQCDEYFDWLKPRARKLGVEVDG